jgi:hypothetical protein
MGSGGHLKNFVHWNPINKQYIEELAEKSTILLIT